MHSWNSVVVCSPGTKSFPYTLFFDGARWSGVDTGIVAILVSPTGTNCWTIICKYHGRKFTNNAAEYFALIHGLEIALSSAVRNIQVFGDSRLFINQVICHKGGQHVPYQAQSIGKTSFSSWVVLALLQLHACFQMIKPGKDWILYHLLWVADPILRQEYVWLLCRYVCYAMLIVGIINGRQGFIRCIWIDLKLILQITGQWGV